MNILYHHRTKAKGAEGVHIYGIVNALKKLGHEITLISPFGRASIEKDHGRKFLILNKLYDFISRQSPQMLFELSGILYNAPSYKLMKYAISKGNIDLIYERYALYSISGVKLAKKFKIPIILEVNIVSDLKDVRPVKMKHLAKKFENSILKNADAIITVSNFLKNHIISQGIKRDKIHVIPNAVDPDEFRITDGSEIRKKYNIENSHVIGFIGSLIPWYNLETLIEIFSEINKLGRENVHLFIVGDGILKENLIKLIKERNINRNVTLTGRIEHHEIPKYINAMDITVLPNSNLWGSPMKIFEYMVMGKPVIAPAYEPIKEVITSGKNGLLFNPYDFNGLRQAIITLMDNRDLCKEIGRNAKETVIKNHTWIKNAERVIEIYKSIK